MVSGENYECCVRERVSHASVTDELRGELLAVFCVQCANYQVVPHAEGS